MTVIVLFGIILGAQALAAASAPPGRTASTGRLLGQTGFAYLGGLRTFAAAVLWNRLEPQFHQYGQGKAVDQRLEFMPATRIVQLLDPQFQQAYYVSAWVLAKRGRFDDAIAIARDGIRNNPNAGLMRANLVQVLMLQDKKKNLPRMLEESKAGLREGMTWASLDDQYEGYGVFRAVFELAGDTVTAERLKQAQQDLANLGAAIGVDRDQQPAPAVPGGK